MITKDKPGKPCKSNLRYLQGKFDFYCKIIKEDDKGVILPLHYCKIIKEDYKGVILLLHYFKIIKEDDKGVMLLLHYHLYGFYKD